MSKYANLQELLEKIGQNGGGDERDGRDNSNKGPDFFLTFG